MFWFFCDNSDEISIYSKMYVCRYFRKKRQKCSSPSENLVLFRDTKSFYDRSSSNLNVMIFHLEKTSWKRVRNCETPNFFSSNCLLYKKSELPLRIWFWHLHFQLRLRYLFDGWRESLHVSGFRQELSTNFDKNLKFCMNDHCSA